MISRNETRNSAVTLMRFAPIPAHIDDLVHTNRQLRHSFELYEEMVDAWLRREEGLIKDKGELLRFSKLLTVDL